MPWLVLYIKIKTGLVTHMMLLITFLEHQLSLGIRILCLARLASNLYLVDRWRCDWTVGMKENITEERNKIQWKLAVMIRIKKIMKEGDRTEERELWSSENDDTQQIFVKQQNCGWNLSRTENTKRSWEDCLDKRASQRYDEYSLRKVMLDINTIQDYAGDNTPKSYVGDQYIKGLYWRLKHQRVMLDTTNQRVMLETTHQTVILRTNSLKGYAGEKHTKGFCWRPTHQRVMMETTTPKRYAGNNTPKGYAGDQHTKGLCCRPTQQKVIAETNTPKGYAGLSQHSASVNTSN